jgi:hypothetical protein
LELSTDAEPHVRNVGAPSKRSWLNERFVLEAYATAWTFGRGRILGLVGPLLETGETQHANESGPLNTVT